LNDSKSLTDIQIVYYKYLILPLSKHIIDIIGKFNSKILKPYMEASNISHKFGEFKNSIIQIIQNIVKKFNYPFDKLNINANLKKIVFCFNNTVYNSAQEVISKWHSELLLNQTYNLSNDTFINASNRQSERNISNLKKNLDKNKNTKLVVLISKIKLSALEFKFVDFSSDIQNTIKRFGRNLYNTTITDVKNTKYFLYFENLEKKLEKNKTEVMEIDILTKLKELKLIKGNPKKLTCDIMKNILKKLKEKNLYGDKCSGLTKPQLIEVFKTKIIFLHAYE
jgi:hypothetical protein